MRITRGTWDGFIGADRPQTGPLNIDLTSLTWAEPVLLAGIAAQAHRATSIGQPVVFTAPQSRDQQNYLSRMRLGRVFDDLGIAHSLPLVNEQDLSGELVELSRFSNQHDGESIAKIVYDRLRDMSDQSYDSLQLVEIMHEALIELATNVSMHAQVEHGYAIAQTYPRNKEMKFAVADGGIGLLQSLRRNPSNTVRDDAEAIRLAVTQDVSGTTDNKRGYGLADVLESTESFGGRIEIASGTGTETYGGRRSYAPPLATPYSGVIVQATIPWEPRR